MKKKPAPDLTKVSPVDVTVAGVPVRAYLDREGRPLVVTAGLWEGDRAPELATKVAFDAFARGAEVAKRSRDSTAAAEELAKRRAQAVDNSWTNRWFALACAAGDCGRDILAQRARSMAAKVYELADKDNGPPDGIPPDSRKKITPARAQQYLVRTRKQ